MQMQPWSWLYVVCFLDLFAASMIMPVFGSHLRSLGISHADIGLLGSLYGVTQLFSGPIVGSWSDIHGRRFILCLAMVVCAIGYGLLGVASSFYIFLIIRCGVGALKHTQTLSRAFVSDIVPADQQASVMGFMNAVTSLSFMIGPVISGHVMEREGGFQYLTTAVLLVFTLNATIVFMFAENTDRLSPNTTERKVDNSSFLEKIMLVFKDLYSIDWKKYWAFFSIKLLFGLASFLFFQNLGVILTEIFDISPRSIGYTISFYGFVSAVCNLGAGKIKSLPFMPKSYLKCTMYTFAVMAVTFLLMYVVNSYPLFIVGLVPLASSHSLCRIFLTEVLLEQSDTQRRGSMVGASSSIASVARIAAPFISGVIISRSGVSGALVVSSLIAASAALLTGMYSRQIHVKLE